MPVVKHLFQILVLVFILRSAWAFIPDVNYILEDITRYNGSVSYKFDQKRTMFDKRLPDGKVVLSEKVYLKSPWKYARLSRYGKRSVMDVYDGSEFLKIVSGKRVMLKESLKLPVLYGFYLSRNPDELRSFLSVNGIDVDTTTMARKNSLLTILFKPRENSQAKLWIERRSFWPLVYDHREKDFGKPYIVEFEDRFMSYGKISRGVYFPMKITRYSDGEKIEEIEVEGVQQNAKISNRLFDIGYLKKKYRISESYYSGDHSYFSRIGRSKSDE